MTPEQKKALRDLWPVLLFGFLFILTFAIPVALSFSTGHPSR